MSDKNFASLGSGLLARKGGAKPAMRPQFAVLPTDEAEPADLEDLGWNDMGLADEPGEEKKVLKLTPEPANPAADAEARQNDKIAQEKLEEQAAAKPAVLEQQEAIATRISAQQTRKSAANRGPRPRRSALARGKRAAFTLRLDADRHLKLRLASTLRGRSAQQLVTEALDNLLGQMSDVKTLAAQAKSTD